MEIMLFDLILYFLGGEKYTLKSPWVALIGLIAQELIISQALSWIPGQVHYHSVSLVEELCLVPLYPFRSRDKG
jgi:uncharacterized protein YggT (Ycf19 family)